MKNYKFIKIGAFDFEVLNANTKEAQHIAERYHASVKNYGARDLLDCYDRPSETKRKTYKKIVAFCELIGARFSVVGYNSTQYSVIAYRGDNTAREYYYFTMNGQKYVKIVND